MRKQSGSTLITVAVSGVILFSSLFYFLRGLGQGGMASASLQNTTVAEWYAMELLEFLRSHRNDQLKGYLQENPFKKTTCSQCGPYPLCAHINYLDRKENFIVNEDPIAELPTSNPLNAGDGPLRANRFYQVSIVDAVGDAEHDEMKLQKQFCAYTANQICLANLEPTAEEKIKLKPNDRFLITVGVTWVPKGKTIAEEKSVVLSTLLPDF